MSDAIRYMKRPMIKRSPSVADNGGQLPSSLQLLAHALKSAAEAKSMFPGFRLTKLVGARSELDDSDIGRFNRLLELDDFAPTDRSPKAFQARFLDVIDHYHLDALFATEGLAHYHHSIRPLGYDFERGEVIPEGMELWRAAYRDMSDERQMLAASIIWLYRAGKDNIWLRRVPCTWHAADAIDHMRARDVLEDWARVFALYPGW